MSGRPIPIYSQHEDDPELRESIHDFVVGLAERIDILQDVHSDADFEKLNAFACKLRDEAVALGYPALGEVADALADACDEEKADAAETALLEMGSLSLGIRRAHRGAA